ncbi:sugar phosphate isomerase/epimerase family protein [Brevibacillus sp. NL20B1]|uniref:sugar phosphate isomerase/epimerase family protein n=1 Tax=Brevibacillus sp. NL20B1 TaxID=2829799 RepID=UPI001B96C719|nr:sugar phosphate isomerase/epimerase [Brevibacillus sp. NL20B1]
MKWSMCTTGWKEHSLEEAVAVARRLGLDGLEIWTGHLAEEKGRNRTLTQVRDLLHRLGMAVPMLSTYANFSPGWEAESLAETEAAMRQAVALGCPAVRVFAGTKPFAQSTAEERERMIAALQQAAKRGEQYGVTVAVELHNNTYADSIEGVETLLAAADHPRLRLIFDGFNLYVDGRDQLVALDRLYRWIDHVHLKNYRWQPQRWADSVPVSVFTGDVDNRKLLAELVRRGYRGFVSFEYFGEQAESCVRQSLEEVKMIARTE